MLKDLLISSRSYRSFDESVKIPYETLCDWIDHTRYCPSSINLQMLKFCIVTEEAVCDALLSCTRWAGKLKDIHLPPKGNAPVAYIVICSDDAVIANAESFQKDVGIVAQTVMLAAAESGFGGCMIGSFSKDKIAALLSLSDHLTPQLVLALGKPNEEVRITEADADGSVTYYRENGIHYVQKRPLEDLIIQERKR
ncbi:MAG: nitroreductase family protein [Clostridia bacterium]|nr:nitroreductase family protein [Clostridia bacterium]